MAAVVHFIGVLFEPLMRSLFGVPGEGAFALSMGLAAGYPMDAVITGRFRRQGICSRTGGLLAFTNTQTASSLGRDLVNGGLAGDTSPGGRGNSPSPQIGGALARCSAAGQESPVNASNVGRRTRALGGETWSFGS